MKRNCEIFKKGINFIWRGEENECFFKSIKAYFFKRVQVKFLNQVESKRI